MKHHRKTTSEDSIDVTPMLDVVFILLIFFIVTTSFDKHSGIDIKGLKSSPTDDIQSTSVILKIDEHNHYFLESREIQSAALKANLVAIAPTGRDSRLNVQANNNAETRYLVDALDAANTAGFHRVSLTSVKNSSIQH